MRSETSLSKGLEPSNIRSNHGSFIQSKGLSVFHLLLPLTVLPPHGDGVIIIPTVVILINVLADWLFVGGWDRGKGSPVETRVAFQTASAEATHPLQMRRTGCTRRSCAAVGVNLSRWSSSGVEGIRVFERWMVGVTAHDRLERWQCLWVECSRTERSLTVVMLMNR